MIVAVDANVIVYAVTGGPLLHIPTRSWLVRLDAAGTLLVTSALSRIECLTGPRRLGRAEEEVRFSMFFDRVFVLGLDYEVLDLGASIRATSRSYRTPDALHLATAQLAQADFFLTADRRLKSFKKIRVVDVLRERPETLGL